MKNWLVVVVVALILLIATYAINRYRIKNQGCGCGSGKKADPKNSTVCIVPEPGQNPVVISPPGEDPGTPEGSAYMRQRAVDYLQNYMNYSTILPPAMYMVIYNEKGEIVGQQAFNPVEAMIASSPQTQNFNALW